MTTTTAEGWTLDLRLGSMWFDLPARHPDDVAGLEAQVDARVGREPALADRRGEIVDMLTHFSHRAHARKAAGAALRWARHDYDIVTLATLHSWLFEREAEPATTTLEALRATLDHRYRSDQNEPSVEVRTLRAAGDALRVQVISDPEPDAPADSDTRNPLLETLQYWLPVPGYPTTLMFAFATPNLAAAELLVAEFDGIMENLRLGS